MAVVYIATGAAMAGERGYELNIETKLNGAQLTIVPVIEAPAGRLLRYHMVSSKHGRSGSSSTSQSGQVSVGLDGSARLSTLSLGVGADDRYLITVKVFDGGKLVAEQAVQYPR